jgi:small conductance mechanosensitive channel
VSLPLAAALGADGETWYQWLYHSTLMQVLIIVLISLAMQVMLTVGVNRVVRSVGARVRRSQAQRPARPDDTADLTAALISERGEQRAESIGQLLRSAGTFAIWAIATITILAQFNIDIGPLLASAGVASVALAFGAQSLVKDYFNGIAMIIEDQYGIGDVVDLGPAIGTVEELTLRVTRVRDANGVVWYVRNGEVLRVANRSQGWTMAMVDIPVAYDEDLDRVADVVGAVGRGMMDDPAYDAMLLSAPSYAGVESVTGDAVMVRVVAKAASNEQITSSRAIREHVKNAFDREGIRVPVMMRFPGPGTAPPAPGSAP